MKTAIILAGALLVGSTTAQDPVDPRPEKPASAAERLQELQDLKQKCSDDWRQAIKDAQEAAKNPTPGKAMPAMPMRPDYSSIVGKAEQYAAEFAGTGDAVPFLVFVLQNGGGDKEAVKGAFAALLEHHVDRPQASEFAGMIPFLGRMVDEATVEGALPKLVASKNPDVRGWALFAMHKATIEGAALDDDRYTDARNKLLAAADEASDERLAGEIRGAIDMREKFGLGCTAPDIAGVDLDGVEFKLSDYRGKVIFLDFWGDW